MPHAARPLAWLHGEIKTPPLSSEARIEAGLLLRRLQRGERLGMPQSRPMPVIGVRCHELRILDGGLTWRIVYRLDRDAVVISDVFSKDAGHSQDRHRILSAPPGSIRRGRRPEAGNEQE